MFSLRDSSSASSCGGTDEDSFGWWIGGESTQSPTTDSCTSKPPPLLVAPSISSDSLASYSCSEDASTSLDEYALARGDSDCGFGEQIELRLLGSERLMRAIGDERPPVCYTPERLVRSDEYRIVTPSPRLHPTIADLEKRQSGGDTSYRSFLEIWRNYTKDDGRIGAAHLAELLRSPQPSWAGCNRCCCIRYCDGEVLLRNERCPRLSVASAKDKVPPNAGGRAKFHELKSYCNDARLRNGYSTYGSSYDISEHSENHYSHLQDSLHQCCSRTDSISNSRPSSPSIADTRGDVWNGSNVSANASEIQSHDNDVLSRRFSDEAPYTSLEWSLDAQEKLKIRRPSSNINEVVSILSDLDNDPSRAEALLDEDRFREATQSQHDCLARLALAIEPDDSTKLDPATVVATNSLTKSSDCVELELCQLRNRIDRLQESSREMYQQVSIVRKDFLKDEWKVNHLTEDVNKLRNEVYELRYLDDLLKLLKGELERISKRNWPFAIGHTGLETEDKNLVV